jgi:aryl-alcohol dehydrogenase-like predicted oxidoreductase
MLDAGINLVDTADVYSAGESERIDLYQIHRADPIASEEQAA